MPSKQRFQADVILCAVRTHLRFALSYQEFADLLAERGLDVDRFTVFQWVPKFSPEFSKTRSNGWRKTSRCLNWRMYFVRCGHLLCHCERRNLVLR